MTHCHKEERIMPRDTFFNLPEDKRNKIIQAAKMEFAENELFKSRVSNIIKTANIPRGSFYQYFEDLDDLYYYVIEEFFDTFYTQGMEHAQEEHDLFEFMVKTFEFDFDAYANDKRHQFIMNVLKSISDNEDYILRFNKKRDNYILDVLGKMDLSNIKFTEKEDLLKMYTMLQDVKRVVIRKSLIDRLTKEEAIKEIRWYIDILRNGLLKE